MNNQRWSVFLVILATGFVLAAGPAALAMRTYEMQQGDTLWDLSAKFYGDPTLYPVFLEVNDIANPRTIPVGREIVVPSYDEMKKIAQEPDPDKRKAMIKQVTGGVTPSNPSSSTSSSSSSSSSSTAEGTNVNQEPSRPIDPKDVSLRKILEGPSVSGDKLKKVETSPESR